jgi:hypothetical protein
MSPVLSLTREGRRRRKRHEWRPRGTGATTGSEDLREEKAEEGSDPEAG